MKSRLTIIISLFLSIQMYGQEPRPDWADRLPSVPPGANFIYVWGDGIGVNSKEAEFNALKDALFKAFNENGLIGINAQKKTLDEIYTLSDLEVKIPNNVLQRKYYPTPAIQLQNKKVKVYVLMQVQKDGGLPVTFENYNSCNPPEFLKKVADWNKWVTSDGTTYPFSPRVFIPGLRQFDKGSNTKAWLFIVGEAAMIGGVVYTENLRAQYQSKISTALDPEFYNKKAKDMKLARNCFIFGAVAVYVGNVIDGIAAKGKPKGNLSVLPYATPNESGVSLAINF